VHDTLEAGSDSDGSDSSDSDSGSDLSSWHKSRGGVVTQEPVAASECVTEYVRNLMSTNQQNHKLNEFFKSFLDGDEGANEIISRLKDKKLFKTSFFSKVFEDPESLESQFFTEVCKPDTCERTFFLTSEDADKFLKDKKYLLFLRRYVEDKILQGRAIVLDDEFVSDCDAYLDQDMRITMGTKEDITMGTKGNEKTVCKFGFRLRDPNNKEGKRKKRGGRVIPLYRSEDGYVLGLRKNGVLTDRHEPSHFIYDVFDEGPKAINKAEKQRLRDAGIILDQKIGSHGTKDPLSVALRGPLQADEKEQHRDLHNVGTKGASAFYTALTSLDTGYWGGCGVTARYGPNAVLYKFNTDSNVWRGNSKDTGSKSFKEGDLVIFEFPEDLNFLVHRVGKGTLKPEAYRIFQEIDR
jgi:hypothetical protein